MGNKIGVSVAQGLDVPNFIKDVPNFVKDVLNFIKDVPNFVKDVLNFIKDVTRVPKFILMWGMTSNHYLTVLKG